MKDRFVDVLLKLCSMMVWIFGVLFLLMVVSCISVKGVCCLIVLVSIS